MPPVRGEPGACPVELSRCDASYPTHTRTTATPSPHKLHTQDKVQGVVEGAKDAGARFAADAREKAANDANMDRYTEVWTHLRGIKTCVPTHPPRARLWPLPYLRAHSYLPCIRPPAGRRPCGAVWGEEARRARCQGNAPTPKHPIPEL